MINDNVFTILYVCYFVCFQLMKLFSAAPMDQHLLLDGEELKGDQTTLASHNVVPNSILYLKVFFIYGPSININIFMSVQIIYFRE